MKVARREMQQRLEARQRAAFRGLGACPTMPHSGLDVGCLATRGG